MSLVRQLIALIARPVLGWLFGRFFSAQVKQYFDDKIAPLVQQAVETNSTESKEAIVHAIINSGMLNTWADALIDFTKIPTLYHGVLREFVLKLIDQLMDKLIEARIKL